MSTVDIIIDVNTHSKFENDEEIAAVETDGENSAEADISPIDIFDQD